jgi:hypothetical protein
VHCTLFSAKSESEIENVRERERERERTQFIRAHAIITPAFRFLEEMTLSLSLSPSISFSSPIFLLSLPRPLPPLAADALPRTHSLARSLCLFNVHGPACMNRRTDVGAIVGGGLPIICFVTLEYISPPFCLSIYVSLFLRFAVDYHAHFNYILSVPEVMCVYA